VTEADRATCPRCGAAISSDQAADLCPRCCLFDAQRGQSEDPSVSPSSPDAASRNRRRSLASAVAAIGAMLFGGLWSGNRRGQQPADVQALLHPGGDSYTQCLELVSVHFFSRRIELTSNYPVARLAADRPSCHPRSMLGLDLDLDSTAEPTFLFLWRARPREGANDG
jgi:hypothetical protein